MITDRRIQFVCGIVLVVLVVVGAGMLLEAGVQGGHHPERYVGRFDPIRAGLLVILGLACGLLAWFGTIAVVRWRRLPSGGRLADVLMPLGLLVSTVAMVAWVISAPPVD